MKEITLKVSKIQETRPADGQECWVLSVARGYPTMQVYNSHCDCWDDFTGDDYELPVSDEDLWMPLPERGELED